MKARKNTRNGKLQSANKGKQRFPRIDALGPEILWKYPGKFIVYSEAEKRVIGVGDTEREAYQQAEASGVRGLWHSTYADRPGEHIV